MLARRSQVHQTLYWPPTSPTPNTMQQALPGMSAVFATRLGSGQSAVPHTLRRHLRRPTAAAGRRARLQRHRAGHDALIVLVMPLVLLARRTQAGRGARRALSFTAKRRVAQSWRSSRASGWAPPCSRSGPRLPRTPAAKGVLAMLRLGKQLSPSLDAFSAVAAAPNTDNVTAHVLFRSFW